MIFGVLTMMSHCHWGSHAKVITELQILMISEMLRFSTSECNLVFDKNVSLSQEVVRCTLNCTKISSFLFSSIIS